MSELLWLVLEMVLEVLLVVEFAVVRERRHGLVHPALRNGLREVLLEIVAVHGGGSGHEGLAGFLSYLPPILFQILPFDDAL